MNPYKIKVVRQIYLGGQLYSKPEKAARAYTDAQCADWWQDYLKKNVVVMSYNSRQSTRHIDVAVLRERQTRMYKRVLPIFKRMLQ